MSDMLATHECPFIYTKSETGAIVLDLNQTVGDF